MNYELTKMCRICLKENLELVSIFSFGESAEGAISLTDKIMACSSVKIISGDGLPDLICSKCMIDLDVAYEFREKCDSADSMLRKYILLMTPFQLDNTEDEPIKFDKNNELESSSYLELDPDFQLNDDITNETSIYDFDKEIYSSDPDVQFKDESDSDEPLITQQQKYRRKKKKLSEKKMEKTKSDEIDCEQTSDSEKKKIKEEKDVECNICKRTFAYMCILKDHMVQHTGARPYLCSACGKSFGHTASLTNHMKTHFTYKSHKCDKCDLSFHRRAHLVLHMRTHTGEKPFVCDVCGRDFAQNSYLKEHMRVHSGEKPFCCDICGHSFARKSCLVMHRRVHTGELPYACPECGRAFSQRSQRKRHVKKNHKGSACLRETGELILKDLDYKNKKLQEISLDDGSISPNLSQHWTTTNSFTFSDPSKDLYQHDKTTSLPLTLHLPKSILQ